MRRCVSITLTVDPADYPEHEDTPAGAVDLVAACLRNEADQSDNFTIACLSNAFTVACEGATAAVSVGSAEPIIYIPPMWMHNRAVIRRCGSTEEFVLRRYRAGTSAEDSFFGLVPVELCEDWRAFGRADAFELRANVHTLMVEYESTDRTMSVMRAPI
jgi:hypothetical protein